ncbi:alanine racemase [Thermovibrio sp.]
MLRWAEVHLDRLVENYLKVRETSGKKIYAVVKANAYGHGSLEVSRALQEKTDVYGFAVATYQEGKELVEGGIKRPILVMSSTVEEGREVLKELPLTPVVYDFTELELVKEIRAPFVVKVDTGMGRLGFTKEEWDRLIRELEGSKVKGVMSHFCCADESKEITEGQLKLFKDFVKELKKRVKFPLEVHAENSAATALKLNGLLTHSRVGLALYGSKPLPNYPVNLKQVMEVKARVLTVKELPPNHPISYGATYKTKSREKVAVVAFGYGDGYPRELSGKGEIVVNGKRWPVRGRVCMDMTIISVDGRVKKGSTATIYGGEITFDEVAKRCGTIPYELMCRISQRVERLYSGV